MKSSVHVVSLQRQQAGARITISNKMIVPALTTSVFVAIAFFAATHSTYDVAFARMNAGQDVSVSSQSSAQAPATSQAKGASINASTALVRLNQADVSQYANQAERDAWWNSACSSASMTEVMNAYGYHYRITDVLHMQINLGVITVQDGLLDPEGIDQTALKFGFLTETLSHPSLETVIATANKGQPVIVSFPPPAWTGGHILVVRGGDASTVRLADSSTLNHGEGLQTVTRAYFLQYWRGFAKVLTPSRYVVVSKPTISVAAINRLLEAYHSPVAGQGQMIFDTAVKYGLDPAFITAVFAHESLFGTRGEAVKSLSPGNLRCIASARCEDGYAQFDRWQAGFEALCQLLAGPLYVGDHRIIPETILPRFAPQADHNDEAGYVAATEHIIDVLRAGKTQI